ncbi:MAG: glycosyltransferase [Chloroflexi bacterium]|nr:glycosyltransferase [Chloroflexota bacterium]
MASLPSQPATPLPRVAHISPTRGGVANAARRLHQGLLKIGVDSRLFLSEADGNDSGQHIYPVPNGKRWLRYADVPAKLMHKHFGLTGMFHASSLVWSFPDVDVIHLHGADTVWFNLHVLPRWGRDHALVWTMHDQHLGTGLCGFPEMWSCDRWRTGCGQCPKVRSKGRKADFTRLTFRRKQDIVRQTQMAVVAPNQWMLEFIAASPITCRQPLHRIPYGIDTEVFTPSPAADTRREFNLPQDKHLLLAVATRLGETRKGVHYLPSLLQHLKASLSDEAYGLVLVGDQLPDAMLAELQAILPVYPLGHMSDQIRLAKIYSAADCFIIPSMIDNFPNVVLESLACGTPVAGFKVGGIPDMIQQGQTGILVDMGDTRQMAVAVGQMLADAAHHEQMRLNCRQQAVREFSLEIQASRYLELYQKLILQPQEL